MPNGSEGLGIASAEYRFHAASVGSMAVTPPSILAITRGLLHEASVITLHVETVFSTTWSMLAGDISSVGAIAPNKAFPGS